MSEAIPWTPEEWQSALGLRCGEAEPETSAPSVSKAVRNRLESVAWLLPEDFES